MMMERPCSSACIRELIRKLEKGKIAYERAYDQTRNKGLHNLYGALASTHVPMIRDLENELARLERLGLGNAPRRRNRLVGMLRMIREPTWLLGDEGMLRTVHRTEWNLLSVYDRHLLKPDLPAVMGELLGRHRAQVLSNVRDIELFVERNTSVV